jgi:hypothetical protein
MVVHGVRALVSASTPFPRIMHQYLVYLLRPCMHVCARVCVCGSCSGLPPRQLPLRPSLGRLTSKDVPLPGTVDLKTMYIAEVGAQRVHAHAVVGEDTACRLRVPVVTPRVTVSFSELSDAPVWPLVVHLVHEGATV